MALCVRANLRIHGAKTDRHGKVLLFVARWFDGEWATHYLHAESGTFALLHRNCPKMQPQPTRLGAEMCLRSFANKHTPPWEVFREHSKEHTW